MELHKLESSSLSFYADPFFVWAAHKNFEVLVCQKVDVPVLIWQGISWIFQNSPYFCLYSILKGVLWEFKYKSPFLGGYPVDPKNPCGIDESSQGVRA